MVLHAFFAAAKEAIVSTRKSRRLQLIEEGRRGAEQVDSLADDASRLLATEQLVLKFIGFAIIAFSVLVYTTPLSEILSANNEKKLERAIPFSVFLKYCFALST